MTEKANNTPILINSFDYFLPDDKIAKHPLDTRDKSKLLIYKQKNITEDIFRRAAEYLPQNSLLVYNNTRVIQARMIFKKTSGARIEIFCLEPVMPTDYVLSLGATQSCVWKCMVGNLKKWKNGILLKEVESGGIKTELAINLLSSEGHTHTIRFSWDKPIFSFAEILDIAGELPIPPYLNRETEDADKISYQTIYSRIKGSVAAPTAGLHFTEAVMEDLGKKGIHRCELTLHVGAGTFQPVKSEDIADHNMHTEIISVPLKSIEQLIAFEGKIVAVGTTTVRTLESLYYIGRKIADRTSFRGDIPEVTQWEPYEDAKEIPVKVALNAVISYMEERKMSVLHARTQIMIKPGYNFKMVNAMFTNFHQPKSTLLLLVSAFTGENWKKIYDYAMAHDFRFLSYGDSSLLFRE